MNFSSILKETRQKAFNEGKKYPYIEFYRVIREWAKTITENCMRIAELGGNFYSTDLSKYISGIDQSCCVKKETANHETEENSYSTYRLEINDKEWSYVRPFFYHWRYESEKNNGKDAYYLYPCCFGITRELTEQAISSLNEYFLSVGLDDVSVKILKSNTLYKIVEQYVDYRGLERLIYGIDGKIKSISVEDKDIFNISVEIHW